MNQKPILISKTIFFPDSGILAFGDIHLGYEQMLKEKGFSFPFSQLENSKKELIRIFEILKKKKLQLKKIIILGDLKHYFPFKKEEKFEVRNFLEFLEEYVSKDKIILIKGNHEKIKLDNKKYEKYYLEKETLFIHGDAKFPESLNKKIKNIIMGHIHPAIYLEDKKGVKKEKFKCFLQGEWKNKKVTIIPSFFSFIEGTDIKEDSFPNKKNLEFSIIPKKELQKFNVYIIGKNKIYNFGKLIK